MASTVGSGRVRTLLWAVAGLLLLIVLIDGGSCTLARIQVSDDAQNAARIAEQSIMNQAVSPATAQTAFAAAQSGIENSREHVLAHGARPSQNFTVNADGSVTLTVERSAPTLVFKHIGFLKHYTVAAVTVTQEKLGY